WGPGLRQMMFRRTTWTNPPFQPTVQPMGDNAAVAVALPDTPFSGEELSRELIAVAQDGARRAGQSASKVVSDASAAFSEFVREIEATMQRALEAFSPRPSDRCSS